MNQIPFKCTRAVRIALSVLLFFAVLTASVFAFYDRLIPDRVSFFEGENLPVYLFADATVSEEDRACVAAPGEGCARELSVQYKLFNLIPIKTATASAYKNLSVYAGGMPFGVKFFTEGITVVGFSDVSCGGREGNPARDAGIRQKDVITHVNGRALADAQSLTEAVDASGGQPLRFTCRRGGETIDVTVTPMLSAEGDYKTGILVRDSGAGIGTVSFILPESNYFAGLGHGICDTDTGALVPICRGTVTDVTISGITKGQSGAPGELRGFFTAGKTGTLLGNTECGVYGVLSKLPDDLPQKTIPIALKDELREGEAHILTTLDDGGICRYSVEISAINRNAEGGKCFTVTVTDQALLEKTGGIVQGMSGSPIIQNGKLVGAVTHVLVSDPAQGYGIFVENMLSSMGDLALQTRAESFDSAIPA